MKNHSHGLKTKLQERIMGRLHETLKLGALELKNRVLMAPLTRCRAGAGDAPVNLNAEYYAQRAGAGLIITEATNVSPNSCAFERAPGIWTQAQVEGWKKVTRAVHDAGGRIFMQLWHCGRVGASGILGGNDPLSPSGVNDDLDTLQVYGLLANGNYVRIAATPSRAMTGDEIKSTVREYKTSAINAIRAGCDGVEVHAANGYLPHQFLSPTTNQRTDAYGGSVENRARFLQEIVKAITSEIPAAKVGVRLSPYAHYNNVRDPDPTVTYAHVAKMLNDAGVAYIHVADTNAWAGAPDLHKTLPIIKSHFRGTIIVNAGITPEKAEALVDSGDADAVAFGRMFIANPDLPERIRRKGPYTELRDVGLYGGDRTGYLDYPFLAEAMAAG
jgi:NADPH2 dehydrogenase/N-ethylmaleimide reductase